MIYKFALLTLGLLTLTACQSTKPTPSPTSSNTQPTTSQVYRTPSGTIIANPTTAQPPKSVATPIPDELKKVWRLTQITGTDNDTKLNQSLGEHTVTIDLTHAPKGSAFAGCNQMSFNIKLNGERFLVNNIASTRMLCFDVMALELALAKHVRASKQYSLNNDTLTLFGQNIKLVFVPNNQ